MKTTPSEAQEFERFKEDFSFLENYIEENLSVGRNKKVKEEDKGIGRRRREDYFATEYGIKSLEL